MRGYLARRWEVGVGAAISCWAHSGRLGAAVCEVLQTLVYTLLFEDGRMIGVRREDGAAAMQQ